ncbi:adenylosuccinate lyase [Mycoplasma sp. SG1]|uniref:adenylosuccinate lyase n=1 Tax=Mycoplasma sp. SG1 TaxID=2810348 RepID=UPI002024D71B|nr:adenylosuccinate lyase [Mycoplasma sp. SG1]URM53024.1 adenylosuccinate lyase [Mycoplasma sp. SG1]
MINRYQTKELKENWSDKNKYKTWLKIELLVLEALSFVGIIQKDEVSKIQKNAKFNLKEIEKIEAEIKHDMLAFTQNVCQNLGPEKKWFHYGLTSSDIIDTSWGVLIASANNFIQIELNNLLNNLKNLAVKYKETFIIGRTHGIHAEITTFGYKFAVWYNIMQRNLIRFLAARNRIEIGVISGAVGNYANIDPFIQDYVCDHLKLGSSKISTQILQRDRHAEYLSILALIASAIEQISVEIRNLQRTEINEVREPFTSHQKGSSSMPHKMNPILSENLCGLSRMVRAYAQVGLENMVLWHERDISHSSSERIIIPDATTLIHYMLRRINYILTNLTVFPENMLKNIYYDRGVIFSQRVLLALVENVKMSREEAYDFVQKVALNVIKNEDSNFKDELIKAKIPLSKEDLDECFNINHYLKNVNKIYKRLEIEN